MTDPTTTDAALVEAMKAALKKRAVETANEDESEDWFATQFVEALLPVIRTHHEAEMAAAVEAERERCAKLVEDYRYADDFLNTCTIRRAAKTDFATAIRQQKGATK